MTALSLTATILRYKADWFTYLAKRIAAEERGESTDGIERAFEPAMAALENWDRPAASRIEAIEALELAIDDYGVGDTGSIPAMMKAALGWMQAESERRQAL